MRIGVYVHIPFCISKCGYCDFLSFKVADKAAGADILEQYARVLLREIRSCGELRADGSELRAGGMEIETIYIGGGTPTVLPPIFIAEILGELLKYPSVADPEITVEANPGTLSAEMLSELRRAGANRLSIGLQAWQNAMPKQLGRIHTQEEFLENYNAAVSAGFENINIDTMFSLPGQRPEEWRETLEHVAALNPAHISAYGLTIENGTPFGEAHRNGLLPAVDDETDRAMYNLAKEILRKNGYEHYEISNFAKPGLYSRHNTGCWERKNYIGLGLGAHSFFGGRRYHNTTDLAKYLSAEGNREKSAEDITVLTERDAMGEFMFSGLRLINGVSAELFKESFGVDLTDVYGREIEGLVSHGMLVREGDRLRLTNMGIDVSNAVMAEFV